MHSGLKIIKRTTLYLSSQVSLCAQALPCFPADCGAEPGSKHAVHFTSASMLPPTIDPGSLWSAEQGRHISFREPLAPYPLASGKASSGEAVADAGCC